MPVFFALYCPCGHHAVVALSRWLHRDEILQRAVCSVCGRREADVRSFVPGTEAGEPVADQIAHYEALPVIEV